MKTFDWERDCGSMTPSEAVEDAAAGGQTIAEYVRQYAESDPFGLGADWLDEAGMIAEMEDVSGA